MVEGSHFCLFLDHNDVIFTQFDSFWNDLTNDICAFVQNLAKVLVINDDVDHFLADLDFLGVLAPPFFLGVVKSLSQTSHTQRPGETDRMNE